MGCIQGSFPGRLKGVSNRIQNGVTSYAQAITK